ncbi:MAG TPA: c-type cytochrome [Magnetovibrio sp.]
MRRLTFTTAMMAAVLLSACDSGYDSADATNSQAVHDGQALYAAHCASCHGDNLQGQPDWQVTQADGTLPAPPHDDSGHTWHHADALLFDYTKQGGQALAPAGFKSAMPAFGETLSDSDIWAVLSFIKSKWSIEAQIRQARMNR